MIVTSDFSHVRLPSLGNQVLRLGVAGNYGLVADDIRHAADRGVNYWVWTPNFRKVTPGLREVLKDARERHVVAMLGVAYTAGMVRRGVEKALTRLGMDYLDCYELSWLGTGSWFTHGIQDVLLDLKEKGRIRSIGISIHDRVRAGALAEKSIIDLFMIRYNAAHPGAERDIFPHLKARNPTVVSYTATSWRQLIRPIPGIEIRPWVNGGSHPPPLTPALCYRFCLSSPSVHVVLTGPGSRAELDQNLDVLAEGPLNPDEEAWIREYGVLVRARKRLPFM